MRPLGQGRVLGPAISLGSPELFFCSEQTLARPGSLPYTLRLGLCTCSLTLDVVRGPGNKAEKVPRCQQFKHICFCPWLAGPTSPGACRTVGEKRGLCQGV